VSSGAEISTDLPGNRPFVLVSQPLWSHYHQRRREIDREWDAAMLTFEGIGVIRHVKASAREQLRLEVLQLSKSFPGTYLVPV